jgi:predicted phosphohydrolase
MIYITGDTHGELSIKRLKALNDKATKDDIVIICGDFGLVFNNEQTPAEKWWLNWLSNKPWTTVFCRGNHENHPKLDLFPTVDMFDDVVGVIAPNVYELKTGHIYNIQGKRTFVFGGAESIDKNRRIQGVSWWPEEIPSVKMFNDAYDKVIQDVNFDLVITHTAPESVIRKIPEFKGVKVGDPVAKMLDAFYDVIKYDKWYCGHWHEDFKEKPIRFIYDDIDSV